MLEYNIPRIDYSNYDVFIGTYINDTATIKAVKEIERKHQNVYCVINNTPGPTSKADNLNSVYNHLCHHEQKMNVQYDIIVMHDCEDVIHPLTFLLYNYLIPEKDMIQTPVFPLEQPHWHWTYWTYADEFAELHTKEMTTREFLKAFVPSAGVGTAFSRKAIQTLAKKSGLPFNTESLVEDYDCALRLKLQGLKTIFLVQHVERMKIKRGLFGKEKYIKTNEIVATRALFPAKYHLAVRQRSRWTYGIALQQWKLSGWPGNLTMKYFLLHDRKTSFANFINFLGYIVFLYWIFIYLWSIQDPSIDNLGNFLEREPWVFTLIILCTLAMLNRIIQRAIASLRVYGVISAILSIPRIIFSNFVNLHAITRAYIHYLFHFKIRGFVHWAKTKNRFPTYKELKHYNRKLGDILLRDRIVSDNDLLEALSIQEQTGEKLGVILMKNKKITEDQLLKSLASNYKMSIVNITKNDILSYQNLNFLSKETYQWLLDNYLLPIIYSDDTLIIATSDPGNQTIKKEALNKLSPINIRFVLTGWSSTKH